MHLIVIQYYTRKLNSHFPLLNVTISYDETKYASNSWFFFFKKTPCFPGLYCLNRFENFFCIVHFLFVIFIFLFGCAMSYLLHVGSSFLIRVGTWAPCTGSVKS